MTDAPAGASSATDGPEDAPVLRVVRGTPTAHELAALVAVLSARAAAAPARAPVRRESLWGAPTALVRRGAGPVGWGGPSATVPR